MSDRRSAARVRVVLTAALAACLGVQTSADSLEISGNVSLTLNTVVSVGGGLAEDTDTTTYSVTNTIGNKKLVGRLNTPMPAHVTLTLQAAAPIGAIASGPVTLTASDQDLVTGIGAIVQSGLALTFTLSATVQAGVVTADSRTVTLTLVDAP